MFFQIVNNGITLHIEKKTYGLLNQLSLPMSHLLNGPEKRLCIAGTGFGKVFNQGETIQTKIPEEELESISQGEAIPVYIWFFPFMGKGWMAINFFKEGKDKSVAIPVNFVAEGGIEI